jgi:hypothetical protein
MGSGHGSLPLCLYVVLSCVGRGLCDELITGPKESYHILSKITETLKRRPSADPGWSAIGGKYSYLGLNRTSYLALKAPILGLSLSVQ